MRQTLAVLVLLYAAQSLAPSPVFCGTAVSGPYLSWQHDPSTTMTVSWWTDAPGTSRVEYGPDSSYGFVRGDGTPTVWHSVELRGLEPGATYHYRAVSSDGFRSEDHTFRTGVARGEPFRFFVYGDTRHGHEVHASLAKRMEKMGCSLVLHTGDFVNEGHRLDEWRKFFEVVGDLIAEVPVMPAIGNHEDNHELYFNLFHLPRAADPASEQWYSFDLGGVHFVSLSTETEWGVGSEQHRWLVSDLESAGGESDWIFVYLHRPLFSSGKHGSDYEIRNAFHPVFKARGVTAVFAGHDHLYERSMVDGITYITSAGGGAYPYKPGQHINPYSVLAVETFHFTSVTVGKRGVTIETIGLDGNLVDRARIARTERGEPVAPKPRLGLAGVFLTPEGEVEVEFALDREEWIRVWLVAEGGREVQRLEEKVFPPGDHRVRWKPESGELGGEASGTYTIRFESSRGVEWRTLPVSE